MKKILSTVCLLLLAIITVVVYPSSPVSAQTDVNNFTIGNYDIDYTLGRDGDKRSVLKTIEDIDAVFPAYDQNHGIERAIPMDYDGHSTALKLISLTDESGQPLVYSTYTSNGNLVVRIGEADTYVHGSKNFKITYSQRDVTRFFGDVSRDQFYWDTNGTGWNVPIASLKVRLHVQDELKRQLTGDQKCYYGESGSTDQCQIERSTDGYSIKVADLSPRMNATLVVGFKQGTFAPHKQSLIEMLVAIWNILLFVTGPIALILVIWFISRYYRKSNRSGEHRSIIPEYVPPKDISVTAAAAIYRTARSVFSAQLIDFAVRGYITIYQTREKSFFHQAEYELEIRKDISDLLDEEQELLRDIFSDTSIGARLALSELKKTGGTLALKLSDNPGKLEKNIKGKYGLRGYDPKQTSWFYHAGKYTLIAAVLTVSPWLLIASISSFILGFILYPLTDKGLATYHYLEGLKMYISMAETERIRRLQGPDTAEKIGEPVDTNDARQLIKLYERTLPYAMIFGLEKEWNSRLGKYYESLGMSPNWFVGSNPAFNAALFGSSISNFSTAATYSNPSSSSYGGSGGGGSSGGGGGGGGGGGW